MSPGKPAPEPMSIHRVAPAASGRSWALSATWRVQTERKVDSEMRLVARSPPREAINEGREALLCFT